MSRAVLASAVLAVRRPPDRLAAHLAFAVATAAFVAGCFLLMRRSWRRRAAAQAAALPEPAPLPAADLHRLPGEPLEPAVGPVEGMYLGTTVAGRWLERVHAHGLGTRGRAEVAVTADGLLVARAAARSFLVPAEGVVAVRLDNAHANRVNADPGTVVVTWRLGNLDVETGFRPDEPEAAAALVGALQPVRGAA